MASAHGAIIRAAYDMNSEVLDSMPNLQVMARTGVGTDRVDLENATKRGIPVVVTPGSNTVAVAEGALAHLLALTKKLRPLTALVQAGEWEQRDQCVPGDLEGRTIAVIGHGRIGAKVAEFVRALGMHPRIFDPVQPVSGPEHAGSVDEAMHQAHAVTLHVPLTAETANLLDEARLGLLAPGAIVVNCSRGGLIDMDAMEACLASGQVAGLGLDVFDEEPTPHHPVFDYPNVTLSPHVMGLSEASARETLVMAAQGVRDFFDKKELKAVANPEWIKEKK
jgi:phosphoglycerate dehydrogenase-like enzyme